MQAGNILEISSLKLLFSDCKYNFHLHEKQENYKYKTLRN